VLLNEHLFVTRVSEVLVESFAWACKRDTMRDMEEKRFNFPHTVPLVQLETGGVRVRNSRVSLETIVIRMQVGDTVEDIHRGFPTVSVSQIKEILAWYFDNQADVDEYLRQGQEEAERIFQWFESRPGYKKVTREELLRRKALLSKT